MTTWQDAFGVVHQVIHVVERDNIVWDTLCFYAVRIRSLDLAHAALPVSCLFCLNSEWPPTSALKGTIGR